MGVTSRSPGRKLTRVAVLGIPHLWTYLQRKGQKPDWLPGEAGQQHLHPNYLVSGRPGTSGRLVSICQLNNLLVSTAEP